MNLDKHNMHGQLGVDPAEKFSGDEKFVAETFDFSLAPKIALNY